METERAKRLADFVSWVGANIRGDEKGSQTSIFSSGLMDGCGETPRNWVSDFAKKLGI
jgi:hypothetical protein